jgi:hypothetical protein
MRTITSSVTWIRAAQVLTVKWDGEGERGFKSFVEGAGLTGLRFVELWNSDDGPKPNASFLF